MRKRGPRHVSTTPVSVVSGDTPAARGGGSSFGYATGLSCRECGHGCALGPHYACPQCFGPLEVSYDFPSLTRADIESGPPSIWRYASLLPVRPDIVESPGTEPGWTRLIRADNLAAALGMRRLWIKDERGNPPIRSRTAWSRSPWPPRSRWASR